MPASEFRINRGHARQEDVQVYWIEVVRETVQVLLTNNDFSTRFVASFENRFENRTCYIL